MSESKVSGYTAQVMILNIMGFIFGFVVQLLIAYYFGASKEVDAFVIANIIPNMIYGFTNVMLMTSLIVVLTDYRIRYGEKRAWRFASSIFNISFLALSIAAAMIFFLSPVLAKIIAPGFDPGRIDLTVKMIRILSILVIFNGLSSITTGVLYTKKHFIASSSFRSIINVITIFSVVLLSVKMRIFSWAFGVVLGAGIALLIQMIVILKDRADYNHRLSLDYKGIKKLLVISYPLIITSLLFYFNKYVSQAIASTQQEGDVAILNYAFLIVSFPVSFFGGSIATAIFPSLTEHNARKNKENQRVLLTSSISILTFILLPLTSIFIVLRVLIIKLFLEYGMFSKEITATTAPVLLFYSVGILFFGIELITGQTFYSIGKMKMRSILLGLTFIINIALSFLLVGPFSIKGLAAATTIAYMITVPLSVYILYRCLDIGFKELLVLLSKTILASAFMGGVIFMGLKLFLTLGLDSRVYAGAAFIMLIAIGIGSYLLFARMIRLKEMYTTNEIIRNLLSRVDIIKKGAEKDG
ncbi:murein biosynthesis integral membrane protein MurJ [Candidatus Woesearchaeota archaeon CG10_big_fil_rev_8_21_14_0_10_44_13]|nr:MAG: murein biosynthesis integral membrane protein MurJ [Candidatus Woesearchaeota archaeon CG10_big_fil_rev_8_21_14_0_10_44_13]